MSFVVEQQSVYHVERSKQHLQHQHKQYARSTFGKGLKAAGNEEHQQQHCSNRIAEHAQQDTATAAEMTIDFYRHRRRDRLMSCNKNVAIFPATAQLTTISKTATIATTVLATAERKPITIRGYPLIKPPSTRWSWSTATATTTSSTPSLSKRSLTWLLFWPLWLWLASIECIANKSLLFNVQFCMTSTMRRCTVMLAQHLYSSIHNFINTLTTIALSPTTPSTVTSWSATLSPKKSSSAASSSAHLSPITLSSEAPSLVTTSLATSAAELSPTATSLPPSKVMIAKTHTLHHYRPSHQVITPTPATAAAARVANNTVARFKCAKQLFCVLVLCLWSSTLPSNSNSFFAAAAKPKSATQNLLQQHHQQPHQSPSNNQLQLFNSGNAAHTPPSYQVVSAQTSNEDAELLYPASSQSEERLFEEVNMDGGEEDDLHAVSDNGINATLSDNSTIVEQKTPLFPTDLFTKQQLEDGWVFCHILGVMYMFVALAIVCDEFFVPSLDVIIEKLGITDDVAGATFMAAGGSAPELFTSVIGVFVSFDDVGIGTIVGSAVFNILFVIGMCALFSKTVLTLTWWPLFRDCTFYSISLIVLIIFFRDNKIYWYEALVLFSVYICYVLFMKWNVQVERFVKKLITRNQGNAANSSETSMATQPGGSVTSRAASETRSGPVGGSNSGATGNSSGGTAGTTQTGAKFRHGLLQLMIHTIDPLHDGKVDEKATQLHAIASLKVLLDATKPQRGAATTSAANHVKINLKETTLADRPNGNIDTTLDSTNEVEDEPEPLSMAWPDTARKRLTYILVAPLLIPMWLTLPDTRAPRGKKLYAITFVGSILWIAAFSYLMVWWANVAGDTARIPPEVMGLTFLAAGTSIPDLITSVIVARKGFGDMAVSSSVGSNIFDVTVGLPIPWLLYGIIYGAPVEVNSVGMVCSITILFMMLLFVVMSIACFRWRMNKGLGFTMFLLYFVFVAVSLMFEYDLIRCPV